MYEHFKWKINGINGLIYMFYVFWSVVNAINIIRLKRNAFDSLFQFILDVVLHFGICCGVWIC